VGGTNTVDDLEQLRRALGEGKLNFAGYSYGTAIGLGYAERHPDRIRALVLDGVDQPDWSLTDLLGNQADSFERAVTSTFARCDRTASCPVHDAGATYDRVAAALEHAPIPDGSGGVIGPAELAIAATTSVYYPDAAQTFLDGLAAAARGDGSGLLPLVEIYRRESRSYAAYAGVTCVDSPHPVGSEDYRAFAKRLRTQAPRFGATVANEMLPCAFWPAAVTHTPHVVTAPGTPTVVLVGTTGDPATPYASAVSVAGQLSNAVLVTLDGEGHTSGDNRCVAALVRTYLVDLVPPTKDARCG
jgi:pimeloyl-ACP methyl ester carboxylesterase